MREGGRSRRAGCVLAAWLLAGCAAGSETPAEGGSASDGEGGWGSGSTGAGGASSSSATTSSGGPATGGGGATLCTYPLDGSGVHVGETVDGSLAWQGYAGGSDAASTLTPADFFDCDGSRGIHAVLVVLSATWCGPCQMEAAALETKVDGGWSALGIRVLTLMVEDASENPATLATATAWKQSFGLTDVAVAADPGFSFDQFDFDTHTGHTGFPTQIVIDPRTMKIAAYQQGDAPLDAELEALAKTNGM